MSIVSKSLKFIPYTVSGLVCGFACGLAASMIITTLKGENPWDECTPVQPHTKIIVPLSCVGCALWGAKNALE